MTSPEPPRRPRVFSAESPEVIVRDSPPIEPVPTPASPPGQSEEPAGAFRIPTGADLERGFRWGALFLSAMAGLTLLALGAWFARFVSAALAREDWVGWLALGLLGLMALAGLVLLGREIAGFARLGRLQRLRAAAETALRTSDAKGARAVAERLTSLAKDRPELAWGRARMAEHAGDVLDAREALQLAERELVAPLDQRARRAIVESAKRVAKVTTLSPLVTVSVGFVLIENVRLMRRLAALYGGRPGLVGALRLAALVVGHILATGGMALGDDWIGQFLGQDLARRLSRRLGEGVFNGMLTARVGTAAIDVCRPLPFLEVPPPRVRDLGREVFQKDPAADTGR